MWIKQFKNIGRIILLSVHLYTLKHDTPQICLSMKYSIHLKYSKCQTISIENLWHLEQFGCIEYLIPRNFLGVSSFSGHPVVVGVQNQTFLYPGDRIMAHCCYSTSWGLWGKLSSQNTKSAPSEGSSLFFGSNHSFLEKM